MVSENKVLFVYLCFDRITKRDLKWHPYKMHVNNERKNYLWSWFTERKSEFTKNELWQECEEGCKSVFKEMEDISKETEIIRVYWK